jgi:hypothetical protein
MSEDRMLLALMYGVWPVGAALFVGALWLFERWRGKDGGGK